ncbi:hypothetical protein ACP4OV_018440 [Aristida adscensionis]
MAHQERLLQLLQSYPQAALVSLLLVCPLVVLLLVRRRSSAAAATAREQLLRKLPSPPALPIIGHLHLIGPLPHVSLRDLAAKHGRDGLLLLRLGAVPTLVVSTAQVAQAVLRTHDDVFASRAYSAITDILFYGARDMAFAPYGEHWRMVKKIATTHLLSNKKVQSYAHARETEVRSVIAMIRDAAESSTATDLKDIFGAFSNDIVCRVMSGKFFRQEGRDKLSRELIEWNSVLLGGFNLADYFPIFARCGIVRRLLCARAHKVNKQWDNLLNKLIDEHASKPVSPSDGDDSDIIHVLLSLQDEYKLTRNDIKAQLMVLLEGATDTTSAVLEYAMAELMRHPHIMNKLQAELRMAFPEGKEILSEDDLNGVEYLKAVVKETLRFAMRCLSFCPTSL